MAQSASTPNLTKVALLFLQTSITSSTRRKDARENNFLNFRKTCNQVRGSTEDLRSIADKVLELQQAGALAYSNRALKTVHDVRFRVGRLGENACLSKNPQAERMCNERARENRSQRKERFERDARLKAQAYQALSPH